MFNVCKIVGFFLSVMGTCLFFGTKMYFVLVGIILIMRWVYIWRASRCRLNFFLLYPDNDQA